MAQEPAAAFQLGADRPFDEIAKGASQVEDDVRGILSKMVQAFVQVGEHGLEVMRARYGREQASGRGPVERSSPAADHRHVPGKVPIPGRTRRSRAVGLAREIGFDRGPMHLPEVEVVRPPVAIRGECTPDEVRDFDATGPEACRGIEEPAELPIPLAVGQGMLQHHQKVNIASSGNIALHGQGAVKIHSDQVCPMAVDQPVDEVGKMRPHLGKIPGLFHGRSVADASRPIPEPKPHRERAVAADGEVSMMAGSDHFELRVDPRGDLSFLYAGALRFRIPRHLIGVGCVKQVRVGRLIAWDTFRERGVRDRWMHTVRIVKEAPGEVQIAYQAESGDAGLTLHAVREAPWHWKLTLRAVGEDWNRLMWGFDAGHDALYGLGTYGDGPRIRRGRLATWVEEGPVGWGPLSSLLRWTGRVPFPRRYATYAAVPIFLSSHGYGGWLENPERVEWVISGGRRRARVWSRVATLHLVAGTDPRETLARQRACLGRPPLAPPWVIGPWIDAVRGEWEVRRRAERLRREEVPATALWVEDWMGSWENEKRFWMRPLRHRLDETLYPDLPGLSRTLHAEGFRLLGYFCPEVAEGTALYQEARAHGHLVQDEDGMPVRVDILGNLHGELELTDPGTRAWVKKRMLRPAVSAGFDGWMADFGEHLPPSARLFDGTSGFESHNRYPGLWHALNREFFEEERPDGDWTFFVRSSSLASPREAPVFWGGDQDTDWDAADGLAAVVPGALSAGILGHALYATDIAGYMTFALTRPVSRELYMRWTELGALLPVMRTHHGTARPRNWHFERDPETFFHFRRFARLHVLLYPYLYRLLEEAHESGLPIVRPLWLYDQRPDALDINQEFLLGEDLLVAPVVQPRSRRRRVYFPPGAWVHWWSGKVVSGPGFHVVPAAIGEIPVFVRAGSALLLSEGRIDGPPGERHTRGFVDTLVGGVGSGSGLSDAEETVTVLLVGPLRRRLALRLPRGMGALLLADGDRESGPVAAEPIWGPRADEHCPLLARAGARVRLLPGQSVSLTVSERRVTVTYEGPTARAFLVRTV